MREITNVRKGAVCWTCRHGQFYKRQGDLVGRGRGWCTYGAGERPYPKGWQPPHAFWTDMIDGTFSDTYEEFLETNFAYYYGHASAISDKNGDLFFADDIKAEYEYMRWLADNEEGLISISWQDVCDQYEDRGKS